MTSLFLIRHGEAEHARPSMPDMARELTARGFADIRRQARALSEGPDEVVLIYHSAYTRAVQTAAVFHEILGAPTKELPGLEPSGNAEAILESLIVDEHSLLLVSHLPLVGEIAFRLTGKPIPFRPGTCACFLRENLYDGRLAWLRHP